MGLTPRDVDTMSVWEFNACAEAFARAHGVKAKGQGMDDDRLADLGIEGFS